MRWGEHQFNIKTKGALTRQHASQESKDIRTRWTCFMYGWECLQISLLQCTLLKFISLLAFATQIFTLISVEFEMLHLDPSLLHRRLSCSHAKVNDIGWHPIKWISRSSSINAGQYANIFQTGTQDWWHNTYAVKLPAYLGWWKAWKYLPNQGVQIMPPRTNPSQGFV